MSPYVPPGHLDAEQTATLLGITRGNLRILVHRGHLTPAGGTDRHPHFRLTDVDALYAQRAARSQRPGGPVRPTRQPA
ncbi:hypothetical protein [Streptomyces sp. NPDC001914]|uniref:hypothetical protein n=1 Tax=Streptomyces sp. NPDC001914 TaxID=3364623 RepID=UPI0036CB1BF0